MTTHDRGAVIAAAKEVGMPQGASDDFHTTLWLWWYPEIERFYAIAFEAGRQAELDAANKDAKRYRWLRQDERFAVDEKCADGCWEPVHYEQLDKAIDRARGETK